MPYEIRHAHHTEGPFRTINELALYAWSPDADHVKVDKAGNVVETYDLDFLQAKADADQEEYERTHEQYVYYTGSARIPSNRHIGWRKK